MRAASSYVLLTITILLYKKDGKCRLGISLPKAKVQRAHDRNRLRRIIRNSFDDLGKRKCRPCVSVSKELDQSIKNDAIIVREQLLKDSKTILLDKTKMESARTFLWLTFSALCVFLYIEWSNQDIALGYDSNQENPAQELGQTLNTSDESSESFQNLQALIVLKLLPKQTTLEKDQKRQQFLTMCFQLRLIARVPT